MADDFKPTHTVQVAWDGLVDSDGDAYVELANGETIFLKPDALVPINEEPRYTFAQFEQAQNFIEMAGENELLDVVLRGLN